MLKIHKDKFSPLLMLSSHPHQKNLSHYMSKDKTKNSWLPHSLKKDLKPLSISSSHYLIKFNSSQKEMAHFTSLDSTNQIKDKCLWLNKSLIKMMKINNLNNQYQLKKLPQPQQNLNHPNKNLNPLNKKLNPLNKSVKLSQGNQLLKLNHLNLLLKTNKPQFNKKKLFHNHKKMKMMKIHNSMKMNNFKEMMMKTLMMI